MKRYISFLLAFSCLFACKEEVYKLSNDKLLKIEGIAETPYKADGVSEIPVTIRLLVPADTENRTVTLTSTGGKFRPERIEIQPDQNAVSVIFIPGLAEGTYELRATVEKKTDVFATQSITLEAITASEVIDVELTQTTAMANGVDLIEGTVALTNTAERTVKLTIEGDAASVFVPENKKELTVEVDGGGAASFQIRTGTTGGTFFVKAVLQDARALTDETSYTLVAPAAHQVLSLSLSTPANLRADGMAVVQGTLNVTNYPLKKAILTLTEGTFVNSAEPKTLSVDPPPSGIVNFSFMVSTLPAQHRVVAKLDGTTYTVTEAVTPVTAFPDDLHIIPSTFELDSSANSSINVDIFLLRNTGKASANVPLTVTAKQVQNGSLVDVGAFKTFPIVSNAQQKATVVFALDTRKAITGSPIVLSASATNDNGGIVTRSVQLSVVE